MSRHPLKAAVAILILLAACGTDDSADSSTPAAPEPLETQTTAETATSSEQEPQPTSTTAEQATGSLVLRADGLGIVRFGQPAEQVAQILEELIGSPPTDQGDEAGWVEFVGWRDLGLYIGFDKPASSEFTGVSRFVGWQYYGVDGLGLHTEQGIGVGSTLSEGRAIYGDRLQVPPEPDECIGDWTYRLTSSTGETELFGTLDRPPADDALITSANAGVGTGC